MKKSFSYSIVNSVILGIREGEIEVIAAITGLGTYLLEFWRQNSNPFYVWDIKGL